MRSAARRFWVMNGYPKPILSIVLLLPLASAVAAEPAPELTFYGKMHLSSDYLHDGDEGGLNVASNSSRIGLKLDYQLPSNLRLLGQIERTVDVSEGASTLSARNTFVGIQGDWGTLRAGYYDSPVKRILNAVEQFREQVGEGRNIVRQGEMHFDRRLRSGLHYTAPSVNNLTWMVHYGSNENSGATTSNDNDVWSTSLAYSANGYTALIGFEQQNRVGENALQGTRAALVRRYEAFTGAVFFQHASGLTVGSQQAFGVTGAYALNDEYSLKAQVFHRASSSQGNADSATMVTFGVNRKLTQTVDIYATAAFTNNAAEAAANVSAGGHGKTLSISQGENPFALSIGLAWVF